MTKDEFLALPEEEQEEILTLLLHQTIKEGEPAVKETAYAMGRSPFTLYKWGSTESEKVPRPRQLIHLMHLKNDLRILDFLETLFGRAAFVLPSPESTLPEINRQVTAVLREVTGAVHTVLDSVEADSPDGISISWSELEGIEKEIGEGVAALGALLEVARTVYRKGQKV